MAGGMLLSTGISTAMTGAGLVPGLIIGGVGAILMAVTAFANMSKTAEKIQEEAEEARSKLSEGANELKELASEIEELKK